MYMEETEQKSKAQLKRIKQKIENITGMEIDRIRCVEQPEYFRFIITAITKENLGVVFCAVKNRKALNKLIDEVSRDLIVKKCKELI